MSVHERASTDSCVCEKLVLVCFGAWLLANYWHPWAFRLVRLGSFPESHRGDFFTW